MKFRNGFVSNSSSSSFVIAVRDGVTANELMKELGVIPGTPIGGGIAELIVKLMSNKVDTDDEGEWEDTYASDRDLESFRNMGPGWSAYYMMTDGDEASVWWSLRTDNVVCISCEEC